MKKDCPACGGAGCSYCDDLGYIDEGSGLISVIALVAAILALLIFASIFCQLILLMRTSSSTEVWYGTMIVCMV